MKKIYLLIITLILLTPLTIKAVEINEITIIGKEQITEGEPFTESILISFDELQQSYDQSFGVLYLKYELTFDDQIFSITSQESPDWDTIIYQESGKYYVLSIVNSENKLKNNCPNSFLYCGDYQNTIEFFPNKITSATTEITISNFELALLEISPSSREYTTEDIVIRTIELYETYPLTINQSELPTEEIISKQDIIVSISQEEINNKIFKSLQQEPIISNIPSNLLSNLEIKDYPIEFNKYKNKYTVTIPKDINTLDLIITPEDDTATYKILGNENLIDNSQITIEVTSTTNQVNIYTINININEDSNDVNPSSTKTSLMSPRELYDKYQLYIIAGSVIAGILILILIIIKIISKIKDKKIEDMTNKF